MADNTILGNHSKFILCHDGPWWRDGGYNGYFWSYAGPISLARDTSVNEQRNYQPACFVNGQSGREWSKLPPHERRPQAMQPIAKMFNVGANHKAFRPIEMFDQIWVHEQYSRGCFDSRPCPWALYKICGRLWQACGQCTFCWQRICHQVERVHGGRTQSGRPGCAGSRVSS